MGFLNPAAWLFSALFLVLVALYLWERHRNRVDVPSLLFWETVPEVTPQPTRFQPDLLFLLQFALLSLLIAGLARPFLRGRLGPHPVARHVFVLDLSASMQAREGQVTRFDLARDALRERLEALPVDDEAMLITSADQARVAMPFSRDHAALLRQLRALVPLDTGTNLNVALAVAERAAMRADRPAQIELFTDVPPSSLNPQWPERIGIVQVGETDDNLAIDALQISQGRFQDYRDARAYIVIRNFSHREAHGSLTVALEDQVLSRRGFSLTPRGIRGIPIEGFPRPGVVHAFLEGDDALASDNHAYGWVRPTHSIRVLVVSEPSPLHAELERIARAAPQLEFRFTTPADYTRDPTAADVLLFQHVVPEVDPAGPSLYLFPDKGTEWFTVQGQVPELPIMDWDEHHPVLATLRPQVAFPVGPVQVVTPPPWADTLLSSRRDGRSIPLAFAGERRGRRVAAIAFDLGATPLLAPDNVQMLLFFLSLLDWLAPSDPAVTVLRTGDVHLVAGLPPLARRVSDPFGHTTEVPAAKPVNIAALHAGEYRVSADGTVRRLFANFFDPAESDIGRARAHAHPPPPQQAAAASPHPAATFDTWLYAFAAVLFALEWLVAARQA